MRKIILASILLAFMAFASSVPAEEIKAGGGGAGTATILLPVKTAFEGKTGDHLINLPSTPKIGLVDLWNNKINVAIMAADPEAQIKAAGADGITIDKNQLQYFKVGVNKTVVFLNAANKVSSLNKEQLKDIFTGKITNWKDVGGQDGEIIVVWGKNSPGQNALFIKAVLDGEDILKERLDTTDYNGIIEAIKSNPDAIGIDPLGMQNPEVRVIRTNPEITFPVTMITKGKPTAGVQRLMDFVTKEGKHLIKE